MPSDASQRQRKRRCMGCDGKGRIGPIWTSLQGADAIERMTEREKDRFRVTCPACGGSGKEPTDAP